MDFVTLHSIYFFSKSSKLMPNNQVLRNMFMCGGKFTFHFKKPLFCVFFFYPLELVLVSAFQFRNSGSRPLKSLESFLQAGSFERK